MANPTDHAQFSSLAQEPNHCANCSIRHSSLCGALTSEELVDLNDIASRRKFERGQSFLMQGDVSHSFANVTEGVAKLVRGAEDGRSQIVGLLFPSDYLGASAANETSNPVPHSIEAVSDLELCVFPSLKFQNLLQKYPALEQKLFNRTLTELQVAREWMVLLGRKTAEERVATFLLHVAKKMANVTCQGKTSFGLPLGRSDIADYLGLTLETVSRQFTRLKKDGIISTEGTKLITFVDEDRLRQRANF